MDVDSETGKVLAKWEKLDSESLEEHLQKSLKDIHNGKNQREEKFRVAKSELDGKKKKMDDLFREQLKKVREEGDDGKPPQRPFDLD